MGSQSLPDVSKLAFCRDKLEKDEERQVFINIFGSSDLWKTHFTTYLQFANTLRASNNIAISSSSLGMMEMWSQTVR